MRSECGVFTPHLGDPADNLHSHHLSVPNGALAPRTHGIHGCRLVLCLPPPLPSEGLRHHTVPSRPDQALAMPPQPLLSTRQRAGAHPQVSDLPVVRVESPLGDSSGVSGESRSSECCYEESDCGPVSMVGVAVSVGVAVGVSVGLAVAVGVAGWMVAA